MKRSRICVKGLPKNLSLVRLKEHFSQKGQVTDAKLLRTREGEDRRFAFVGYRTEQETQEAIKYFNKSFVDTSRITCEFAWKVGDPNIPRSWSRYSKEKKKLAEKNNLISGNKAKLDKRSARKTNVIDDPKLQEFLHVMQPQSKSKLWADDLIAPTLNQICKGSEKPTKSKQEDQRKSTKELNVNTSVSKENRMHDKNPAESQNVAVDYVVTDIDYFKSRIRKDWSDSERNTDGNGIDFSQHADGPVKANQEELDVGKQFVVEEQESLLKEGLCELTSSGNQVCSPQNANELLQTGQLYVCNLYYGATEDEVAEFFNEFGNVKDVQLVIDKETNRSKGFGYVTYSSPEEAAGALKYFDHPIFQGRILHIVPAETKDSLRNLENHVSEGKGKTFKQKKAEKRRELESRGHTRAWNSLFMRSDTIVENIARKYGVSKSSLLDCEAEDLAVRVALGETQIIEETKKALANAGVNVASLEEFASGKSEGVKRSNHVLLVKNLPYSSSEDELSKMFGRFGSLDKIILPSTRTLALVIFLEPAEARAAFNHLRYKCYRDAILYLEWAPNNILSQDLTPNDESERNMVFGNQEAMKVLLEQQLEGIYQPEIDPDRAESRTLYVMNLNFKTTEDSLRNHIRKNMKEGKILSVRILKHLKEGKDVSRGYGFVEFDYVETASTVCRALQGTALDGHALSLQPCHLKEEKRVLKKAENDRSSTKLIVRNVAFEATKKDLSQLLSPFGQLKNLRLPKRFGKHRGFAFVEYVTKQEAQNALKALSNTHLYGRRLNLERAKSGETLEELRARTAAQFANEGGMTRISKKRKIIAVPIEVQL